MLWGLWSTGHRVWQVPLGLAFSAMFSVAYIVLDRAAELIVKPSRSDASWTGLAILAVFLFVAVVQTQLPRLARTSFGTSLYVHARNGFYINTLANRITTAIWPVRVSQEVI